MTCRQTFSPFSSRALRQSSSPEFAAASVRNAKLKEKIVVGRIVTRVDRRLLLSAKTGRAKRKGRAYET